MECHESQTIDFTSIFKGYRIPIPFFLLCIGKRMWNFGNSPYYMDDYFLCSPQIVDENIFEIQPTKEDVPRGSMKK